MNVMSTNMNTIFKVFIVRLLLNRAYDKFVLGHLTSLIPSLALCPDLIGGTLCPISRDIAGGQAIGPTYTRGCRGRVTGLFIPGKSNESHQAGTKQQGNDPFFDRHILLLKRF
jgi:hypothetical protein